MRRMYAFLVLAAVVAAGCIRLGFWQIARLHQRQAQNALVVARLEQPPVGLAALPRDSGQLRFRRVAVPGTYDFARELVYGARTHQGSPGINFLTPLRLAGSETLLVVNRGWVYAPDAATVDPARWREADTVTVHGYAEPFPAVPPQPHRGDERVLYRLDRREIERLMGAPVYPFYIVLTDSSAGKGADAIARVEPPPLDEGPHRSYAIQWFAFAAIALAGGAAVAYQRRNPSPRPAGGPPPRS